MHGSEGNGECSSEGYRVLAIVCEGIRVWEGLQLLKKNFLFANTAQKNERPKQEHPMALASYLLYKCLTTQASRS